jgi:pyocin large subunit-like protein
MAGNPHNPQNQPGHANLSVKARSFAFLVGELARAAIITLCWIVALCAAAACTYLAVSSIIWLVGLVKQALGLE